MTTINMSLVHENKTLHVHVHPAQLLASNWEIKVAYDGITLYWESAETLNEAITDGVEQAMKFAEAL